MMGQERAYLLRLKKDVAEIKVRAERRAGEMLREAAKNGERVTKANGGANIQTVSHRATPLTLSDIGITRSDSSRWQKVASLPDEHFEAAVEMAKNGERATSSEHGRGIQTSVAGRDTRATPADIGITRDQSSRWQMMILSHALAPPLANSAQSSSRVSLRIDLQRFSSLNRAVAFIRIGSKYGFRSSGARTEWRRATQGALMRTNHPPLLQFVTCYPSRGEGGPPPCILGRRACAVLHARSLKKDLI